jgi:uncharacterized protein (DUF427 family)
VTAVAVWNGVLLAESDETIIVEGNHYFPFDSIKHEHFEHGATHSWCRWKGEASYLSITTSGAKNTDAAFYYPDPIEAAGAIKGYVAFWHGVQITADATDGTPGPNPPSR